jgi:hypothetical protein
LPAALQRPAELDQAIQPIREWRVALARPQGPEGAAVEDESPGPPKQVTLRFPVGRKSTCGGQQLVWVLGDVIVCVEIVLER